MKLSVRIAAPAAALVLAGLTAAACALQTSGTGAKGDEKTGTLRVWLFQEVGNKPKEQVVDAAVADFRKAHEGAKVEIEYIPVDTRAQRIKAAFNDPESAPDLIEYGNTDTAGWCSRAQTGRRDPVHRPPPLDAVAVPGLVPPGLRTERLRAVLPQQPARRRNGRHRLRADRLPGGDGRDPVQVPLPHHAADHVPGRADGAGRGADHPAVLP